MRNWMLILFAAVALGFAGCTAEQNQRAADGARKVAVTAEAGRDSVASPAAKTIAAATGTEPFRQMLEWGLGGLATLATVAGGYFAKKAGNERRKKKAYKAGLTDTALTAANKVIYGDKFKAELSK